MCVIGYQAWPVFRRLLWCSGGPAPFPGMTGSWPAHSPTGSCRLRGWCARVLPRRRSRGGPAKAASATIGRTAAQGACAVGAAARSPKGRVAGTAMSLRLPRPDGGLHRPCPRRVASTLCGAVSAGLRRVQQLCNSMSVLCRLRVTFLLFTLRRWLARFMFRLCTPGCLLIVQVKLIIVCGRLHPPRTLRPTGRTYIRVSAPPRLLRPPWVASTVATAALRRDCRDAAIHARKSARPAAAVLGRCPAKPYKSMHHILFV